MLCIIYIIALQCIGAPDSSPATATAAETLKTALISVTCVLVMMSAFIGFICGHCFSQRWRKPSGKKDDESPSNLTTESREDLELKENIAYITIHPR